MKNFTARASIIVFAICPCFLPALAEQPVHHVTARVAVESSNDYQKIKGSSDRSKKQERQLVITLDSRDKDPTDLTVKWTIFGHAMKDNKQMTLGDGSTKVTLEGMKTATVKSDVIRISGTPKHAVTTVVKGSGKNPDKTHTEKKPASGEEYYGYNVQVFAGAQLLEEIASQPGLKSGAAK
ncbi:MAG: hypothetical protein KGQ89_05700 [Verrucomicrobia bacterium]|nr:hypothetical protein [Verrucomicrobiota bacterium]